MDEIPITIPDATTNQLLLQTLLPMSAKVKMAPNKLRTKRISSAENCGRRILTIGTESGPEIQTATIEASPIFTERVVPESFRFMLTLSLKKQLYAISIIDTTTK